MTPPRPAFDSYIICTTPRSGSTLLCGLLEGTGRAGRPDSFFMGDLDPHWAEVWSLPDTGAPADADHARAFVAAAKRAGTGGNAMFGLRLMHRDLARLLSLVRDAFPDPGDDAGRLRAAFGRWLPIHLTRADKLAQAVSRVRAEQSGLWHIAPDGRELERLAPAAPVAYDFDRIAGVLAELEAQDGAWQRWFDTAGMTPLRLTYEDLAADMVGAVAPLFDALGLPLSALPPEPTVAKLADGTSQAWIEQFRKDRAERGA